MNHKKNILETGTEAMAMDGVYGLPGHVKMGLRFPRKVQLVARCGVVCVVCGMIVDDSLRIFSELSIFTLRAYDASFLSKWRGPLSYIHTRSLQAVRR